MGERVYEDMLKVQAGEWTVRVWMEVADGSEVDGNRWGWTSLEILRLVGSIPNQAIFLAGRPGCARLICTVIANSLPDCAAVEVLDRDGQGSLVYLDWP